MAVANTYVEPTTGTSLNTARGQFNDAMRALLTNFKGPNPPTLITADGVSIGEQDGMLYRSPTSNALYISDTANKKNGVVGGNFTRWGIGHRVEPSLAVLTTNLNTYEIGELVATLDTGKLYFRNSNTAAIGSFLDVGNPTGYSVQGPYNNVTFTGQNVTAITLLATANVGIGTSTPTAELDVRGNVNITGNTYLGSWVQHVADLTTRFGFPSATTSTFVIQTNNAERVRVDLTGNVGVGTASPMSKLDVTGNVAISTNLTVLGQANVIGVFGMTSAANAFSTLTVTGNTYIYSNVIVSGDMTTASDARLKENVKLVSNALNMVSALEGVYYTRIGDASRRIGVIAQQVEQHLPEVVSYDGEYKSVAYGNIVGLLIEAIKELRTEVDYIKATMSRGV